MKIKVDGRLITRCFVLFSLCTVFGSASSDFFSTGNIYSLGQDFALLGLVTLGLSLAMIAGEFDLSLGAVVAVAGLVMLKLGDTNPLLGIGGALLFGVVVGLFNAIFTLAFSISSLVVTLGTMIFLKGVAVWIEGGTVVSYSDFDVVDLVDHAIAYIFSIRSIVTLSILVLVTFILKFTRLGRDIIATGSSRKAASSSRVRVKFSIIFVFVTAGACAALAGSLLSISLATASSQFGGNLILQAATGAILGGVALRGGQGNPFSIALGVLILVVLNNGLSLLGVHSSLIALSNGLLLLLVMLTDKNSIVVISDSLIRFRSAR